MYNKFKEHFNRLTLNYFDKFLIINLEKDKKRLQDTISQLLEYGVNRNKIVRIDAIYERWNGHLGCGKSHVKALEYAITNNLNNVVILEDDFNITSDVNTVNKLITTFVSNIKDWDVLDFAPCHANKKDILTEPTSKLPSIQRRRWALNPFASIISRLKSGTCATGYAVNRKYYDILLQNRKESVKLLQKQTDDYLEKCKKENNCKRCMYASGIAIDQYHNRIQEKHNWYAFKSDIADQNRGGSTIMSEKFYIRYTSFH